MGNLKKFGNFCEKMAKDYLTDKGYKIVCQNYRKPWGEIDIIAKLGDVWVFVEVKASKFKFLNLEFSPQLRVDDRKIRKIIKTAQLYFQKDEEIKWRVDVIGISYFEDKKKARIAHFKNVADNFY